MESEWTIHPYSPADKSLWDSLVASSRQGTMLHFRDYMDYHSEKFQDCSLIASRKGKPLALLPANLRQDGILSSHQGLTYGGWLTPCYHFDGTDMLHLFDEWLRWCSANGIKEITYKAVPHIYHRLPAEEDIYALFRFGAQTDTINLSSVIDLNIGTQFNSQQKRNLRKAEKMDIRVRETENVGEFMPILSDCLLSRHSAVPVHSESELQMLKKRFPKAIRLFLAGAESDAEAAVCIYDTNGVAHTQYIATSESGRENGTLAYLINHLIKDIFVRNRYFDLGTSNEDAGRILNSGLLHQKFGFGARGVVYPIFRLTP